MVAASANSSSKNYLIAVTSACSLSATELQVPALVVGTFYYGSRPEIYRAVGSNALVQLSLPSTPEPVRLKIEERIRIGDRITGAEVIRLRTR
jgi:hypothetical protein